ncbi:MAG TPA: flagellar basal body P-ring protein FlgI [Acetobacteraceae bacterium]|nr:flagellar basal body P-ring protein FlgI [Acetobacteraceae bacterium]
MQANRPIRRTPHPSRARRAARAAATWRAILSTLPIALTFPSAALPHGARPRLVVAAPESDYVRIKDIADLEGVRENQLVGYGLIVGLNGTGDKLDNAIFTRESLVGMLERLGVNTRDQITKLETKDVAAVMVTASLPAFSRGGSRIDVGVSAIGDATNLSGGTLLVTPLLSADGEVYAVAQGAVVTGAVAAKGAAASVTRNIPTAGKISNGAIVEREVNYALGAHPDLFLSLRNPDLTTARRIEAAINAALGPGAAQATDPRSVSLKLEGRDVVSALATIEDLRVEPDSPAVVIVDEASGTIVMGANVRISTVAIAQGNLTIRVTETPEVSQPAPFSNGKTTTVPRSSISVDTENDHKLGMLNAAPTLRDLVASLNALGVGPRDLISILQSIKAAGALQADLEVR